MPAKSRCKGSGQASVEFSDREFKQNFEAVKPNDKENFERFPQRLKRLMDGTTKNSFAVRVGVSQPTVDSWLNGQSPGIDKLWAIIRATGCSASWLLTGEGEPYPQPSPETEAARAGVAQAVEELIAAAQRIRAAIDALGPALSPEQRQRLAVALAGPDPAQANSAATSSSAPPQANPPIRPPGDRLG